MKKIKVFVFFLALLLLIMPNQVNAGARNEDGLCVYGRHGSGDITKKENWVKHVIFDVRAHNDVKLRTDSTIVNSNCLRDCSNGNCDQETYTDNSKTGCSFFGGAGAKIQYLVDLFPTVEVYEEFYKDSCPERIQVCTQDVYNAFNLIGDKMLLGLPVVPDSQMMHIYSDALNSNGVTSDSLGKRSNDFFRTITGFTTAPICKTYNHESIWDGKYLDNLDLEYCLSYQAYISAMRRATNESDSCDGNEVFKKYYNELDALCRSYFASVNYATGVSLLAKSCSTSCAHLPDDVLEMCGGKFEELTGTCNSIGSGLLGWIYGIFRIMYYVVPVLLILLGIIDFLKSIASQSDDELKKAGGRFAKRLLAAAIVFIVPLILRFMFGIFDLPGMEPTDPFCANQLDK